jgi:hypothetical protein
VVLQKDLCACGKGGREQLTLSFSFSAPDLSTCLFALGENSTFGNLEEAEEFETIIQNVFSPLRCQSPKFVTNGKCLGSQMGIGCFAEFAD